MAVLPIYTHPHPTLRQKAKRVRSIDSSLTRLIGDMLDTMRHAQGVGLAAPQVGLPLRVAVIQLPEQEPIILINPEVVKRSGERVVPEGCLSFPGYQGELKRAVTVTVKAINEQGKPVRIKGEELLAQALEHELDHLNGILYLDRVEPGKLFKVEEEHPAPATG